MSQPQQIEVRQVGQAEYHIPVNQGVATEAGKDAVAATVTIYHDDVGVHETFDAKTGELIDISEPEE
jgi:hypothetical protein